MCDNSKYYSFESVLFKEKVTVLIGSTSPMIYSDNKLNILQLFGKITDLSRLIFVWSMSALRSYILSITRVN